MKQAFQRRAALLHQGLNSLPGFSSRQSNGAFYAFPNITGTGMTSNDLQTALLEDAGVALISGTSFEDEGEGYLRFSYFNSDEAIKEALSRIQTWLESRD